MTDKQKAEIAALKAMPDEDIDLSDIPERDIDWSTARRGYRGLSYRQAKSGGVKILNPTLIELIEQAPWREAVTYRDTWPHEYVLLLKDGERELMGMVRDRMKAGEGTVGRFFRTTPTYLFIGDYKYWFMTHHDEIDLDQDHTEHVLNRVRLYRDRRDFVIQPGDTGKREDYPTEPARE